jgi:hypothetical protein
MKESNFASFIKCSFYILLLEIFYKKIKVDLILLVRRRFTPGDMGGWED